MSMSMSMSMSMGPEHGPTATIPSEQSMRCRILASQWLNAEQPIDLAALRGRVVLIAVFQMLCEGCARFSLPQARRLHLTLPGSDFAIVGLHSVFEHHHVMTPEALRVFVHEYRLGFPIAVDRPREGSPIPATMAAWALGGTPSLLLLDREGRRAFQHLGHIDDRALVWLLGRLAAGERVDGAGAGRIGERIEAPSTRTPGAGPGPGRSRP